MEKQGEVGDEDEVTSGPPSPWGRLGLCKLRRYWRVRLSLLTPLLHHRRTPGAPVNYGGDVSNLLSTMATISTFVSTLLFLKELEQMGGDPEPSVSPARSLAH